MRLLRQTEMFIFLNTIMYILSFITFIIGIRFQKKHKELSHLFIYSLASFLQTTISVIVFGKHIFGININLKAESISLHIFIVLELFCIYFFFLKTTIITGLGKKALPIFFIFFVYLYFLQWLKKDDFLKNIGNTYFLESLFILFPCFIYLFQLFVKPPTLNLLNEPSFWFSAGLLIYFTLTLPSFFMINYLTLKSMQPIINNMNFVGYCIVFSFLIRAYLCKSKTVI